MTKKYFVTWVSCKGSNNFFNSSEIAIDHSIAAVSTPGQLAEILERKVSKKYEDQSVVIINFWEI